MTYRTHLRKMTVSTLTGMALLMLPTAYTHADVGAGMNNMWNYTAPAMGGVNSNYGGTLGGLALRSPVRSFSVMAFDPPRFSAGCGGIDAYFGSFSMISGDNIQNLVRAIISNAAGYAVKLALDNLCPPCQAIMSDLQDWTTKINSYAKNTCQLSTETIDAVMGKSKNPSAFGDSKSTAEAEAAASSGAVGDFAEANNKRTYSGKNANRPANADKDSTEYGNNLMNTLASTGVFTAEGGNGVLDTAPFGGHQAFLEMAMSLYGTQITLTGADAQSSASGGDMVKGSKGREDKILEPIWTFRDMVEGAPTGAVLTEYHCKDFTVGNPASCQNVTTRDSKFPGTKRYLMQLLIGKQTAYGDANMMGDSIATTLQPDSIMAYLRNNETVKLTPAQAAFLETLPASTRDALSIAAKAGDRTAVQAAQAAAQIYGDQMAAQMILAMHRTLSVAFSANVLASGKKVVPPSETQRKQLELLQREAQRKLDGDAVSHSQQMFVSAVKTAVMLTGDGGETGE